MDTTANLLLPFIMPAQAQKFITHNEALETLDALVQLSVRDRDLAAPPGSPAEGDRYLVATGATGAWAGKDRDVAVFADGGWSFCAPIEGWRCWVEDEAKLLVYAGSPDYWVAAVPRTPVPVMGNSNGSCGTGELRYFVHAMTTGPSTGSDFAQAGVYMPVPEAGSFSDLDVAVAAAPGAGQSWTFTLQKLFADTALTATISGASATEAGDATHQVHFAKGDRWCLKVAASAGTPASGNIVFGMNFTPD